MPPPCLFDWFLRSMLVTRRFVVEGALILVCLAWLVGCSTSPTSSLPTATMSPISASESSPLAVPVTRQDPATPVPTPTLVSPPGVPDDVVYYAGVARYLIPRLPTEHVLEQWNKLIPPMNDMRTLHEEFATSMERFIQAHQAFNDAAFGRSETPLEKASDDLDLALQSHLQAQENFEHQLDQFMRSNYDVSLDEIPEIIVSLQP